MDQQSGYARIGEAIGISFEEGSLNETGEFSQYPQGFHRDKGGLPLWPSESLLAGQTGVLQSVWASSKR